MKTDELREKYLEFFQSKGCVRRPSDVLVPRWDPSVLFTPAGMNQFKDHFLGKCKLDFTKATTCQKCLRTGDIDNVGRTAYHHTFFEMLGNFSFGDYFKREAIHWAWEFLTQKRWLGINAQQLSVTVYLDDDEAYDIWHNEIKLPPARIRRLGEHDNFWPAGAPTDGPDGVCGPCSEIFFHPDEKSDVEIWNLVFTQFNRVGEPPDNLRPLPSKNIDTGMGLERTASVLQGVETNFHIDILRPLVEAAAEICGQKYEPGSENGRRLRRIADHVRACTFAIHEGVTPDKQKEKYVIRRLLRRAVLDGHQMGVREPFLCKLVGEVASLMKGPYPELGQTVDHVAQVIQAEENTFLGRIGDGLERLQGLFATMKSEHRTLVPGAEAANLYTTHGFPPELLENIAAEHNLAFDWEGYRNAMELHGELSGSDQKRKLFGDDNPLDAMVKTGHSTEFLGYESSSSEAKVVGIIAQGHLIEQLDEVGHDDPVIVVLDRTPFYGESGGQVGDSGRLTGAGVDFEVLDTQKDKGFFLHKGHLRAGKLSIGDKLTATVDTERRQGIRRAHSATHILHYALQKYVGGHAQQQGSKVDRDLLRFDFSNPSAVTPEQLEKIETEVNEQIAATQPVSWKLLPIAEARTSGAMMLFGEKYPDIVRMVSIGDFSKELCGGTHLDNSGQVGLFRIAAEESVSAGTRRITALTGKAALEHSRKSDAMLAEIATSLRIPVAEIPNRVQALAKEVRELKKQLAAGQRSVGVSADTLLADAQDVGGVKLIVAEAAGSDAAAMRGLIDQLRKKVAPAAILLGSRADDKVTLVAGITRDLEAKGLSSGEWVKTAAEVVGGKGGGRADLAQAGGKHPEKLPAAIEAAREKMRALLAG